MCFLKIGALRRSFPAALSSGETVILPLYYSARLRLWFSSHYSQHSDVSTEAPCCNLAKTGKSRGRKRMPRGCSRTLKEMMIDPIAHRWAQHFAVTTFRCRHGTAPPNLRKKLKSNWRPWTHNKRLFLNLWNSIFFQSPSPYLELSSQRTARSRFCYFV